MLLLSWIGFGAFLVASLLAGLRLLVLYARTRKTPELMIGLALLLFGPLGYAPILIGRTQVVERPQLGVTLMVAGIAAQAMGAAAIYLFSWRTFRSDQRWATPVFLVGIAVLVTSVAADLIYRIWVDVDGSGASYLASVGARIVPFLWLSAESLLYWSRMRRRLALGLTTAVACNRFLMWATASGLGGCALAAWATTIVVAGRSPAQIPAVSLLISAMSLCAAIAIWLTFWAPRPYRRWLERRALAA